MESPRFERRFSPEGQNMVVARSFFCLLTIALALVSLSCGTCGQRPFISSISPNSTPAGGNQFLLTVNGSDFHRDSLVNWNGSFRVTSFLSGRQLAAAITVADVAKPGSVLTPRSVSRITLRRRGLSSHTQTRHSRRTAEACEPGILGDISIPALFSCN